MHTGSPCSCSQLFNVSESLCEHVLALTVGATIVCSDLLAHRDRPDDAKGDASTITEELDVVLAIVLCEEMSMCGYLI